MSDLKGTVWAKTRGGRTTYVRVTDHGPSNAFVAECDAKGRALFTLGRGYTVRQVSLSHEGTRVKGRKQVQLCSCPAVEVTMPAGWSCPVHGRAEAELYAEVA